MYTTATHKKEIFMKYLAGAFPNRVEKFRWEESLPMKYSNFSKNFGRGFKVMEENKNDSLLAVLLCDYLVSLSNQLDILL